MKTILFVSGSLRVASASTATARALGERISDVATSEFGNIGSLPHYNADLDKVPDVDQWIKQLRTADGVVFVTPEYNYSIPGVLKNAIDWASRPAFESVFKDKRCFVISVSGGALGGVRAQSHLKYVLNGMLADTYTCKEIVVPMANTKVENRKLTDVGILDFAEENLRAFIDAC